MRVLVCGGRAYANIRRVHEVLNNFNSFYSIKLIIEGGASGPDRYARWWSQHFNVECLSFPADWTTHGRSAGPIRNSQMLRDGKPDIVVAFPGGRGTADMIRQARAAGIRVEEISA